MEVSKSRKEVEVVKIEAVDVVDIELSGEETQALVDFFRVAERADVEITPAITKLWGKLNDAGYWAMNKYK